MSTVYVEVSTTVYRLAAYPSPLITLAHAPRGAGGRVEIVDLTRYVHIMSHHLDCCWCSCSSMAGSNIKLVSGERDPVPFHHDMQFKYPQHLPTYWERAPLWDDLVLLTHHIYPPSK